MEWHQKEDAGFGQQDAGVESGNHLATGSQTISCVYHQGHVAVCLGPKYMQIVLFDESIKTSFL